MSKIPDTSASQRSSATAYRSAAMAASISAIASRSAVGQSATNERPGCAMCLVAADGPSARAVAGASAGVASLRAAGRSDAGSPRLAGSLTPALRGAISIPGAPAVPGAAAPSLGSPIVEFGGIVDHGLLGGASREITASSGADGGGDASRRAVASPPSMASNPPSPLPIASGRRLSKARRTAALISSSPS